MTKICLALAEIRKEEDEGTHQNAVSGSRKEGRGLVQNTDLMQFKHYLTGEDDLSESLATETSS